MANGVDLGFAHLRVARPTDDLAAVVRFYHDGLGLDVLFEFQDHDGFDGVMLGRKGAIDRLAQHGYQPVLAFNPYWDGHGRTFADPDGYRVVLQNATWLR
jgi:catechol 2,3-dioxygenase-like lactoylglutathione lyase family enzyme